MLYSNLRDVCTKEKFTERKGERNEENHCYMLDFHHDDELAYN